MPHWQQPGQQPLPGQWQQAHQQTWQVPPAPRSTKKGGSKWWLLLPFLVLGLMVGYFILSRDVPNPPPSRPAVEVTYVNEDYAAPAMGTGPTEIEDSFGDPSVLTSNDLYMQTVPTPVRCEPPEVSDVTDKRELQSRMANLSECLTKTFGPALEDAGYVAYQPRVVVYDTTGTTPCGPLEPVGAFYCGANQGIYVASDISTLAGSDVVGIDYVFAHEYAHNLQGRAGILAQRIHEHRSAAGVAEENEVNRRLETQADCLAGSFFKSAEESVGYTAGDKSYIVDVARSVGDDQFLPPEELPSTHGTSASRELWVTRGFDAVDYGDCNTFVAPVDEIE